VSLILPPQGTVFKDERPWERGCNSLRINWGQQCGCRDVCETASLFIFVFGMLLLVPARQLYFQCDETLSAARGQIWPLNSSATQAIHYNE